MPVLFQRWEKHAYSWSDKYLSGIYLNERVHLQTFPGSEILSWAHRGRIISLVDSKPGLATCPLNLSSSLRAGECRPQYFKAVFVPPPSRPVFLLWAHAIGSVVGKMLERQLTWGRGGRHSFLAWALPPHPTRPQQPPPPHDAWPSSGPPLPSRRTALWHTR